MCDGISGQYYLRARFYNPRIGKFLQEDVYRGDGLNLYAYCQNNPVMYYDPSGYVKLCPNAKTNSGNEGTGDDLTGGNWEFNPQKDVDLRGTGKTYQDALDEAFNLTGVPREEFTVTKWGTNEYGKSIPVEWKGPNGASVNMDIPQWNNVKPNGLLGEGPHAPHIGYQTAGK
jgi:RHS repeat-associated core domain